MKCLYFPYQMPKEQQLQVVEKNLCRRCLAPKERIQEEASGVLVCQDCGASSMDGCAFQKRLLTKGSHRLQLDFSLSKSQEAGSRFFLDCVRERVPGFLQAVCGAGKTEMVLEGICMALNSGWRVCIAIPRKPVVIELYHRLKRYFPITSLKMLHGEMKDDQDAPLLISTIPQLIHYQAEFDLLILDEIDAYPFRGNVYLKRLVQKALKPTGILLQMSATMDLAIQKEIEQSSIRFLRISERYHGHPLDLPRCVQVTNLYRSLSRGVLPEEIALILKKWQKDKKPILCFVSKETLGRLVVKALQQGAFSAELIYSQTKQPYRILDQFRRQETEILVTTTLLERGVTFPHLSVMVMDADHPIFTRDVLIQVSGRVGRHRESPSGEILFCSKHKTKAMVTAIRMIRQMNELKNSGRKVT